MKQSHVFTFKKNLGDRFLKAEAFSALSHIFSSEIKQENTKAIKKEDV